MKRRKFITLLGGATAALPLVARVTARADARIGVLSGEYMQFTEISLCRTSDQSHAEDEHTDR
jgi:hypothetical protein